MGALQQLQSRVDELLFLKAGGTWGIVLEDLNTKEQLVWNGQESFYAASVMKVPIMVAAYAAAWEGGLSLEDRVRLTREMQVGGDGVLKHMQPGLELKIHDLITLMIIRSDNTATNMMIDLLGREQIRSAMVKLGMTDSHFYNKLMIVPAELQGYNTITALDVASCYRSLALGKAVSYHASNEMIAILKNQQVDHGLPSKLPYNPDALVGEGPLWELAHKTGTVEGIQHDCGILYVGKHSIVVTALSKNVNRLMANDALGQLGLLVYETYRS